VLAPKDKGHITDLFDDFVVCGASGGGAHESVRMEMAPCVVYSVKDHLGKAIVQVSPQIVILLEADLEFPELLMIPWYNVRLDQPHDVSRCNATAGRFKSDDVVQNLDMIA